MSHKFLSMVYQAASYPECCLLVDNALDCLGKQIEEQITVARLKENSDRILSESNSVQPNEQRDEDLLSAARLKKKEVQPKSSKRHRSWLEKTHKFKKKCQTNLLYVYENLCCIFLFLSICQLKILVDLCSIRRMLMV